MITFSGKKFDVTRITEADVDITDIAMGLSFECRWNGHLGRFFSVAQHSVIVSHHMPKEGGCFLALLGLLHDGSEAYMKDIGLRLKKSLPDYLHVENHVQNVIYRKYLGRLPTEEEEDARHVVDKRSAVAEYLDNKPGARIEDLREEDTVLLDRLDTEILPLRAEVARSRFLSRFYELMQECSGS